MQDSIAVSGHGGWHIVNATPDVRFQIENTATLRPGPGIRETPIHSLLLTDAELDHTIGLLILRERTAIDVRATRAVLDILEDAFPVKRILQSYACLRFLEVTPGESFPLDEGSVVVTPVALGCKRPGYGSACSKSSNDLVVGYRFHSLSSGRIAAYAPQIGEWNDNVEKLLADADLIFCDGTFASEDELVKLGITKSTASAMGHLPLFGKNGLADKLCRLTSARKFLIHVNNTNPVLDACSPESAILAKLGIRIAEDGMEFEL